MRNKLELFVHGVWTTWDRRPFLIESIRRRMHRDIEAEAHAAGATVLAIGGTSDHVHVLVRLPATVTVAELAKQMKGVSSHFANDVLLPNEPFRWQGGYAAFTVSPWDVDRVRHYVQNQERHHAEQNLIPSLEESGRD
jgi:putative transposase